MDKKTALKKIRKAAKAGRVEFAGDEEISQYEDIAEGFLGVVLDLDRWFISDESSLSDFSTCGLPEGEYDSLEAARAAWDEWIVTEIKKKYGIKINSTAILLLDLFKLIEHRREFSASTLEGKGNPA